MTLIHIIISGLGLYVLGLFIKCAVEMLRKKED
jgi:hypothetical protein